MASTLKLTMEELYEDEYQLIAIHTSLEDYRLAYFLNQSLSIQLKKCEDDLHVKSKRVNPIFLDLNMKMMTYVIRGI